MLECFELKSFPPRSIPIEILGDDLWDEIECDLAFEVLLAEPDPNICGVRIDLCLVSDLFTALRVVGLIDTYKIETSEVNNTLLGPGRLRVKVNIQMLSTHRRTGYRRFLIL